jgi:hypothetical protein
LKNNLGDMSQHNRQLFEQFQEDVQYFIRRFEKRASTPGGEKFQTPLDRLYSMKDRLAGLGFIVLGDGQESNNSAFLSQESSDELVNDSASTSIESLNHLLDNLNKLSPTLERLEQYAESQSNETNEVAYAISQSVSDTDNKLESLAAAIPDLASDISTLSLSMEANFDSISTALSMITLRQEKQEAKLEELQSKVQASNSTGDQADSGQISLRLDALAVQVQRIGVPAVSQGATQSSIKNERLGQLTHAVRELEALTRNVLRELGRHGKAHRPGKLPGGSHRKPPVNKPNKRRSARTPKAVEFPTGKEPNH